MAEEAAFDEFDLLSRLLLINEQAQLQNAAHPPKNQLTLVNASGTDALVWLIGPLEWAPMLQDKESTTVHVPAGRYHVKLRYGMESPYLYFRGEEFNVMENADCPSQVTIVFHRTADDSYKIYPISASEFVEGLDESIKRITGESERHPGGPRTK